MSQWIDPPERAEQELLISSVDLTRFTAETRRRPNVEIATAMDAMYRRVGAAIAAAGGRVVKFIGDASLVELRQRFKKHTPPVSYIRSEDPRPFRYTAR